MNTSVFRVERFNAAHRLHNKDWTEEVNKRVFGLCNNPNYHGHNYKLVVELFGEVDPRTGYLIDLKILKDIIRSNVTERFDHTNLNLDIEEFKDLNPTAENIAWVIWNILRREIDKKYELTVTLFETEKNYVKYNGQ